LRGIALENKDAASVPALRRVRDEKGCRWDTLTSSDRRLSSNRVYLPAGHNRRLSNWQMWKCINAQARPSAPLHPCLAQYDDTANRYFKQCAIVSSHQRATIVL